MTITIIIEIFAFVYLLIIGAAYFNRKKANTYENYLYAALLVNNFIQLILEFSATFLLKECDYYPVGCMIVNKAYMIGIGIYVIIMSFYVGCSLKYGNQGYVPEKIPMFNLIFSILALILTFTILVLPITFNHVFVKGMEQVYVTGPGVTVLMIFAGIFIIYDLILIIFVKAKNKHNSRIAFLLVLICYFSILISRFFMPGITLLYAIVTLTNIVMYFVIQNPDAIKVNELNDIKREASKYNNQKSEFLSNMSHEIRTALDIVQIYSGDIINSDEKEEVKEDVQDIIDASENLLEVIGNIIDINKIETNDIELNNVIYDLKKELSSIVKMNVLRIGGKQINLKINIDDNIPETLYGDKVKIKQILNNLISNAIKYTEEGTVVVNITSTVENDICNLNFEVEDTGIGIKDPSRLFTKFDRMDIDKTSKIEGTGLGLVITRSLIQLLGGTLQVESTVNKGSKFYFSIKQEVRKLQDNKFKCDYNLSLPGKSVIICDDNPLGLNASRRFFAKYKFRIDTCSSGGELVNMVRANKYDLVLLDSFMPEMNGIETLNNIKKINANIPVVALTADVLSDSKNKYLEAGFTDYISKPIKKEEVDEVLYKIFKE